MELIIENIALANLVIPEVAPERKIKPKRTGLNRKLSQFRRKR